MKDLTGVDIALLIAIADYDEGDWGIESFPLPGERNVSIISIILSIITVALSVSSLYFGGV